MTTTYVVWQRPGRPVTATDGAFAGSASTVLGMTREAVAPEDGELRRCYDRAVSALDALARRLAREVGR